MKQLLPLIIYIITISIYSQDLKEFKQRLVNETDRERIETYLDISELPIPRDTVIIYLNKALETSKRIKYDSIYPIQFGLTVAYYMKGDFVNAKKEIKKGFKTYNYTEDPQGTKGHINMLLGVFNEAESKIDSAKYYYDNVITTLENIKTEKAISILSSTYTNYGNLYLKTADYEKAIKIYLDADKMSEEVGDTKNRIITLNNVAGCYKELGNYDKAINYYKSALKLSIKEKDIQNQGSINLGIGEIYVLKKDNNNGLKHFLKAEKQLESVGFKKVLNIAYHNISATYLNKNNITKAKYYSEKAIKGINLTTDNYTKVSVLFNNSTIHFQEKNYNKALIMIDKALDLANQNNYQDLKKECLIEKIKVLKSLGKTNKLPVLYDELLIIKDSIINKENIKAIANVETKYQTEKKEKENLKLKAEKAEQELQFAKEAKTKQYFAFGLLASLLTLGVFVFYYQRNKKQKSIIENLQKDLHHRVKNNLAIIDSLVEDIKDEFDNDKFSLKLTDLQNRIDSINEVHQQLYKNIDITNLKFKKYVEKLANNVQHSFAKENIQINNNIADSFTLDVEKSFPIGLIINEFLTNSFKYAFTSKDNGVVTVDLKAKGENYILSLSDNGKGLPKELDISKLNSFGMDVMQLLSKQLKGTFKIDGTNGVNLQIEFPKV